jgi:farnesyl-diphosphate farnesyltransferase
MLSERGAEAILATSLDRVLKVFDKLPEPMQTACVQWIGEMVRGMSLYSHRLADDADVRVLTTLDDLERYCYFVAGTVGQLLTGLFCHAIPDLSDERKARMQANAESFGLGLQMVNILKDQTDDLARGWCFVPQTLWRAQGLAPCDMLEETSRDSAHAAVAPVFDRAQQKLAQALEYTLAIPAEASGVRLFCLLPLWMAARTLVLARGNDAMFIRDTAVKISRDEVAGLIASVSQNACDDDALREQYAELWRV